MGLHTRIILLLCSALCAPAATLRVNLVPERTRTTLEQPIRITLTVVSDKNLGQLPAPQVPPSSDFSVLRVDRNQSSSSSISIVNGRTQRTVEISYFFYYVVAPKRLGTFTFPALSFDADGATYSTRPFAVEVVDKPVETPQVVARLRCSRTSLYVGEQTVLSITVGQKPGASVQLTSDGFRALINAVTEAGAGTFSLTDLTRGKIAGVEEILDGERYTVYRAEFSLVPIASGSPVLGPAALQYNVLARSQRRGRDPFDDFFGGSFFGGGVTATPATTMSNSLRFTVKPLPPAPSDFCGAVGTVTLTADVTPRELPAGEAATLKIALRAPVRPGSLADIVLPRIPNAEVFTPEKQTLADTTRSGIATRRSYKYLVIPRAEGTLEIPSLSVSWFDPASGSYRSAGAGPFTLSVSRGAAGTSSSRRYLTQEEIREVGQDIRYIKTPPRLAMQSRYPHRSIALYLVNLLPFIIVLLSVLYRLQAERHARDPSLALRKGAYRTFHAALSRVRRAPSESDVLGGISSALDTYLSRRFRFAAVGMTSEERDAALSESGVPGETRAALAALFSEIDAARFGGMGHDTATQGHLVATAEHVAAELERHARRIKR